MSIFNRILVYNGGIKHKLLNSIQLSQKPFIRHTYEVCLNTSGTYAKKAQELALGNVISILHEEVKIPVRKWKVPEYMISKFSHFEYFSDLE